MKTKRGRQIVSSICLGKREFSSLSIREKFWQTTEGGSKLKGRRFGKYMKRGALGKFWSWQAFGLPV